ncbi:MAG TPA: hypothetical protein VHN15_06280 [Thermoanaerobaculia bacterium]|nr:hypothetical protein [Thermoanaerobaculia bacterium]
MSRTLGSGSFLALLEQAQTDAVKVGASETAYAPVAEALEKRLFTAVPSDQRVADDALAELKTLIEGAEEPRLILARLVGSRGELLYLPFGS